MSASLNCRDALWIRATGAKPIRHNEQTDFVSAFLREGPIGRRTKLLHTGVMSTANRAVRQSVTLPANVATQVRRLAKARRLSASRMLLELIENGIEAEKRRQQEFFHLAERFRNATDMAEVERLGEQMGRMVFGS